MAEMTQYIVRQGDTLVKLAYTRKFDADAVWNDAKNEDLRKLRPDANILFPGDILYVPEAPPDELSVSKGTQNDYAAEVPTIEISLVLQDSAGEAIANEEWQVLGLDGEPLTGTTGSDGSVKVKVPVLTREFRLVLPKQSVSYAVGVGDLDPPDTESGVRQRLAHLGFLDSPDNMDGDAISFAIRAFQVTAGLEATGEMDDATREALVKAHGGH